MSMTYWTLEPPAQWRAGFTGTEPNKVPFYFDCADCSAKEPPIAGILSTDGTFSGIGLIRTPGDIFVKTAMFCAPCLATRLQAETPAQVTTVDELVAAGKR